jgi:aminoethylphosphonate catabolism LysR family transcriptional regulator
MRYVQLRAFHHVAICGGFSRAAETLGLTQPAISDQVRKLEEQYDVILFNRNKKQVTLTQNGQHLLTITRRFFEIENQASELLSESLALRSGSIRIIADSAHHLLHILGRFRQNYPGIDVSVRSGNSQEVVTRLYNYEADIGVLGEAPKGTDFETIKLNSTPLIAFAAMGQAVSGKQSMSLAELLRQPLVLREPGSKTRQKLEEAATERGLLLKAAIEAEGREAVREIVATGAGVGIVSAAEFSRHTNLVAIQIADCEILMEEALVCLRERASGRLVRAFLDIAKTEASPHRFNGPDKKREKV